MEPAYRLDTTRRIVLAKLTYQRPVGIARLLPKLVAQAEGATTADCDVSIVVVDNNPLPTARDLVRWNGLRTPTCSCSSTTTATRPPRG